MQRTYLRWTSVHWRWGAKQAIAQTFISIPVWNCLFLMSQTPWTGVAIALFWKRKEKNKVTLMHRMIHANKDQLRLCFSPTKRLFIVQGLSLLFTPILPYKDHSITLTRQLARLVKRKACKKSSRHCSFLLFMVFFGYINQPQTEIIHGY